MVIDLSHHISRGMPVYPDTEPPVIVESNSIEHSGFAEKLIIFSTHTGTHIDAPAHMFKGGKTLDRMDADQFIGRGCVIDISQKITGPEEVVRKCSNIIHSDFVLLYTGWSEYWGTEKYFKGFPVPSEELATFLTGLKLKGVGIDAISVDPVGSEDFRNHFYFFRKGMITIENLTNLKLLLNREFLFSCLPLKIRDADGSPVRACALMNE